MTLSHRHMIVGTIDRRRALGLITEAEALRALAEAESGIAPPPAPPAPPEPLPVELIATALMRWSGDPKCAWDEAANAVLMALEARRWQITRRNGSLLDNTCNYS